MVKFVLIFVAITPAENGLLLWIYWGLTVAQHHIWSWVAFEQQLSRSSRSIIKSRCGVGLPIKLDWSDKNQVSTILDQVRDSLQTIEHALAQQWMARNVISNTTAHNTNTQTESTRRMLNRNSTQGKHGLGMRRNNNILLLGENICKQRKASSFVILPLRTRSSSEWNRTQKTGATQAQIERATELAIKPAGRSTAAASLQGVSKDEQGLWARWSSLALRITKMPSPSRVESAQVHWVESGASKEHEGEREGGREEDKSLIWPLTVRM